MSRVTIDLDRGFVNPYLSSRMGESLSGAILQNDIIKAGMRIITQEDRNKVIEEMKLSHDKIKNFARTYKGDTALASNIIRKISYVYQYVFDMIMGITNTTTDMEIINKYGPLAVITNRLLTRDTKTFRVDPVLFIDALALSAREELRYLLEYDYGARALISIIHFILFNEQDVVGLVSHDIVEAFFKNRYGNDPNFYYDSMALKSYKAEDILRHYLNYPLSLGFTEQRSILVEVADGDLKIPLIEHASITLGGDGSIIGIESPSEDFGRSPYLHITDKHPVSLIARQFPDVLVDNLKQGGLATKHIYQFCGVVYYKRDTRQIRSFIENYHINMQIVDQFAPRYRYLGRIPIKPVEGNWFVMNPSPYQSYSKGYTINHGTNRISLYLIGTDRFLFGGSLFPRNENDVYTINFNDTILFTGDPYIKINLKNMSYAVIEHK